MSKITDAANKYVGHEPEIDESTETSVRRMAFEDGAKWAGKEAKETIKKLIELADKMYYANQYLATDASHVRRACDEYHHFKVCSSTSERINPLWDLQGD